MIACSYCLYPLSNCSTATRCDCGGQYCSEACQRSAANSYHGRLCSVGMSSSSLESLHALYALLDELPSVGEAFEIAVRILAAATCSDMHAPTECEDATPVAGMAFWNRVKGLAGAPWWDTA